MTTLREIKTLDDKREVFKKIIEQIEYEKLWQIGYYYNGLFVYLFSDDTAEKYTITDKRIRQVLEIPSRTESIDDEILKHVIFKYMKSHGLENDFIDFAL
nr:MAG TPA: hypothetical protein [Caudoviricetes sp.]